MGERPVIEGVIVKVTDGSWYKRITVRWPDGTETQFDDPYDRHQAKVGGRWTRYEETR